LRGLLLRFVGLIMLLGLLGLIIGCRSDMEWYRLLAGGYALTRASLSCIHATIAWSIRRARGLCLVNAGCGLLLAVAPAVLAWQETHEAAYPMHIAVMAVAAVGEFGTISDEVQDKPNWCRIGKAVTIGHHGNDWQLPGRCHRLSDPRHQQLPISDRPPVPTMVASRFCAKMSGTASYHNIAGVIVN
jgi:hypothetical protein